LPRSPSSGLIPKQTPLLAALPIEPSQVTGNSPCPLAYRSRSLLQLRIGYSPLPRSARSSVIESTTGSARSSSLSSVLLPARIIRHFSSVKNSSPWISLLMSFQVDLLGPPVRPPSDVFTIWCLFFFLRLFLRYSFPPRAACISFLSLLAHCSVFFRVSITSTVTARGRRLRVSAFCFLGRPP